MLAATLDQATLLEVQMRKILTGALATLTLAGALAAAAPASAHDRHRGNSGAAVAAGIAGLAIGAALASGNDGYYYYDRPYYGSYYAPRAYYYDAPPPGYYAGPRYYYRHGGCRSEWRWDRWSGGYVRVRACY